MNYHELGFATATLLRMLENKKTNEKVIVSLLQDKLSELKEVK